MSRQLSHQMKVLSHSSSTRSSNRVFIFLMQLETFILVATQWKETVHADISNILKVLFLKPPKEFKSGGTILCWLHFISCYKCFIKWNCFLLNTPGFKSYFYRSIFNLHTHTHTKIASLKDAAKSPSWKLAYARIRKGQKIFILSISVCSLSSARSTANTAWC